MSISLSTSPVDQFPSVEAVGVFSAVLVYVLLITPGIIGHLGLRSVRASTVLVAVAGAVLSGSATLLTLPVWHGPREATATTEAVMCGTLIASLIAAAVLFLNTTGDRAAGVRTVVVGVVLTGLIAALPGLRAVTHTTDLHLRTAADSPASSCGDFTTPRKGVRPT